MIYVHKYQGDGQLYNFYDAHCKLMVCGGCILFVILENDRAWGKEKNSVWNVTKYGKANNFASRNVR